MPETPMQLLLVIPTLIVMVGMTLGVSRFSRQIVRSEKIG